MEVSNNQIIDARLKGTSAGHQLELPPQLRDAKVAGRVHGETRVGIREGHRAGEELTYDYNPDFGGEGTTSFTHVWPPPVRNARRQPRENPQLR